MAMFRYQVILSVTRQLCHSSRKTSKKCVLDQLNHIHASQTKKSLCIAARLLCKQEYLPVEAEAPGPPIPQSQDTPTLVAKLRGLPYTATLDDIVTFLGDVKVDRDLIRVTNCSEGAAFVFLKDEEQLQKVLQKHRQFIGDRYIEVVQSSQQQADSHVSGPTNKEKCVVLRGLPFSVTKPDIVNFFSECNIQETDVWIDRRPNGLLTGKAYVKFHSDDHYESALQKHKQSIGSRYIEVFPSSGQSFGSSRLREGRFSTPRATSQFRRLPQMERTSKNFLNAVRMRGVPYKASVSELIQFFKPLEPSSVDILCDDWGRPSGEALVKFFSKEEMLEALKKDHAYMGNRYIELTAELQSY